jgi:hypothetical protein
MTLEYSLSKLHLSIFSLLDRTHGYGDEWRFEQTDVGCDMNTKHYIKRQEFLLYKL